MPLNQPATHELCNLALFLVSHTQRWQTSLGDGESQIRFPLDDAGIPLPPHSQPWVLGCVLTLADQTQAPHAIQASLPSIPTPCCLIQHRIVNSEPRQFLLQRVSNAPRPCNRAALAIEPRTSPTQSENHATRPSSLQRLRTRVVFDAYTQRVTRDATPHRDDAQDMRGHVCMRAGVSSQWKQHSYEVELQHSNQNPKCWHLHLTMHLYSMVSEHEPTPV